MLLIEFSTFLFIAYFYCTTTYRYCPGYELSRNSPRFGTPERPLSDLGLRSYVTYWISVLVRFFR